MHSQKVLTQKSWQAQGNPDLNDAIDRIDRMQTEINTLDSENHLYQMEVKQLNKENTSLAEALASESEQRQLLT